MILTHLHKEFIEEGLRLLDFVQWDRFVDIVDNDVRQIRIFGWIPREKDSYKDFIVLDFTLTDSKTEVTFITSSKDHSKKIDLLLFGPHNEGHTPCQRVEDAFEAGNSIKAIKTK